MLTETNSTDDRWSHGFYNGLPSVEDAYDGLRATSRHKLGIEESLNALADAGMGEIAAISLVHRHWPVGGQQLIVERRFRIGRLGPICLSSAERADPTDSDKAPYRFAFDSEALLIPLEYTTLNVPREIDEGGIQEVAGILQTYGLTSFLGVTLIRYAVPIELIEMETSHEPTQASLVELVDPNELASRDDIPTSWTMARVNAGCRPITVCGLSYCSQIGNDPHEKNHSKEPGNSCICFV